MILFKTYIKKATQYEWRKWRLYHKHITTAQAGLSTNEMMALVLLALVSIAPHTFILFSRTALVRYHPWVPDNSFLPCHLAVIIPNTCQYKDTTKNNSVIETGRCWNHLVDKKNDLLKGCASQQPFLPWQLEEAGRTIETTFLWELR